MKKPLIFYENWLYQEKRPFEEKNGYKEQTVVQKNERCDLYVEMLNYN